MHASPSFCIAVIDMDVGDGAAVLGNALGTGDGALVLGNALGTGDGTGDGAGLAVGRSVWVLPIRNRSSSAMQ